MTVQVGRSYQRRDVTDQEWDAHEWERLPTRQGITMFYCARERRQRAPMPVVERAPHACRFKPVPVDPKRYPWPKMERCWCGRRRNIDISLEEMEARLLAMGPEEAARWAAFMPERSRSD